MNPPTAPAVPTGDARHALAQLDTALTAVCSQAETAVKAAEQRADQAERRATIADAVTAETKRLMERRTTTLRTRATEAEQDAERFKADHLAACRTIADMHEAATGRTGMGPIRGVVEDVADMRAAFLAQQDRADTLDRLCRDQRARAEHLADELTERSKRDGRTEATLQRVRDAETLAAALAAVAEHDGLTPAQAAMSAAFATAAETPAAIDAERERDHAIRLAAAEQGRAEAVRVADRATSTLLRIRYARTAADAWTAIGTHYQLPAVEAGRAARKWRTETEHEHDRHRRNLAAVFALSADTTSFEEITEYAAKTLNRGGERLLAAKARADRFEAAIARVRALFDTHLGPLATAAVRAALDTPKG